MKTIESVVKWFAGFFQDQKGIASRKALALYVCLYYLKILIAGSMEGKTVNETILLYLLLIILFCLGAITLEFFKENASIISSSKTSTTKTDTKEVTNDNPA